MDYVALKTELTTDPLTRGYSAMDDVAAAVDLNTVYRERDVESVTGQEIFEAAVTSELDALTDAQRTKFYAIIGMGEILVNGTNTKAALLAMFGAGTTTRTNLGTLQKQSVSRAVELGLGTVAPGDVENARMM